MRLIKAQSLLALTVLGCSEPSQSELLTRADSAGIEIVYSAGPDRIQDFPAPGSNYLLDTDGSPYLFTQYTPQWVRTSSSGDVVVIASDRHALARFDSGGRFHGLVGKRGQGPGEFGAPFTLMLRGDTIAATDGFKRAVLRWSHLGDSLLPQITWPEDQQVGTVYAVHGEDALAAGSGDRNGRPWRTLGWVSDSAPLISFPAPQVITVTLPCSGGMPTRRHAYLTPQLHIATSDSLVVVVGVERYEVWILDDDGVVRSIRRAHVPRPPTESEVKLAAGRGLRHTINGVSCSVSARDMIDSVGVADVYPAVHDLSITSDGSIWVSRTFTREEDGDVDQFALDGSYLGTWRNAPLPLAVLPDGRLIVRRSDENSGGLLLEIVRLPALSSPSSSSSSGNP